MSDNEYYSASDSDSDSDSENSDKELLTTYKNPSIKSLPNVLHDENDESSSDSDSDKQTESSSDSDDDDDDSQKGGYDDDDDDDDIEIDENGETIQKTAAKKSSKTNIKIKKPQLIVQDEDDEDEDDDENYLQKFDNDIMKNYVNEFHPECLNHNYDEITKLSIVVRNSDNIIIDPLHRTIPYLTKYEKARILGQRAKQIETGAKPLVKIPENIVDSYIIAELELREKKIPFIIRRPIPGGACEYWNLRDLEVIAF